MKKQQNEYDAVADAHRQISELRLEAHDREANRQGDDDERFGRMLAGAMAEQHERNYQEARSRDETRHEELLTHLKAMSESHDRMAASHEGLIDSMRSHTEALQAHTQALQAYTASRDGEIEVRKTGTVDTPQGKHTMNVVEIHRRSRG